MVGLFLVLPGVLSCVGRCFHDGPSTSFVQLRLGGSGLRVPFSPDGGSPGANRNGSVVPQAKHQSKAQPSFCSEVQLLGNVRILQWLWG